MQFCAYLFFSLFNMFRVGDCNSLNTCRFVSFYIDGNATVWILIRYVLNHSLQCILSIFHRVTCRAFHRGVIVFHNLRNTISDFRDRWSRFMLKLKSYSFPSVTRPFSGFPPYPATAITDGGFIFEMHHVYARVHTYAHPARSRRKIRPFRCRRGRGPDRVKCFPVRGWTTSRMQIGRSSTSARYTAYGMEHARVRSRVSPIRPSRCRPASFVEQPGREFIIRNPSSKSLSPLLTHVHTSFVAYQLSASSHTHHVHRDWRNNLSPATASSFSRSAGCISRNVDGVFVSTCIFFASRTTGPRTRVIESAYATTKFAVNMVWQYNTCWASDMLYYSHLCQYIFYLIL